MTDQEIVKGLIWRDSRVTAQFFFKDCRPLMLSVIHRVFDKQKVDYDEVISELYIYLMSNDAQGCSYGSERNDQKKETPDMIPYCNLPESEKLYDREMAMQTLKLVKKLGWEFKTI